MKKLNIVSIAVFLIFLSLIFSYETANSNSGGAPAVKTGSPSDGNTCFQSCHNSFPVLPKPGLITSNIPVTGYVPGNTYTITASISSPGKNSFGFEVSPQASNGSRLGTIVITNSSETQFTGSGQKWITHKNNTGVNNAKTWTFDWIAPPSGTGDVTFYGAFIIGNGGSGNSLDSVKTSTLTVSETTILTPSVSISQIFGSNPACAGDSLAFLATVTNGASPSFQWLIDGNNVGSNSPDFGTTALQNGQTVSCVVTNTGGASATSNGLSITVNPLVTPTISISTPSTTFCAGEPVVFSSQVTNQGTAPTYQWKVNSTSAGTNSAAFTSSSLSNGDTVRCLLTSNEQCISSGTALSNFVVLTQALSVLPTITIAASDDSICAGESISFTSAISNGGSTPSYQWKLNGVNVGTNSSTFNSSNISNNDTVTCTLTSSSSCTSASSANSSALKITVSPNPIVSVSPSGNVAVCIGDSLQLTASGGGTYSWSNGEQSSSIIVSNQNTYSVTVTANGCTATDAVILSVNSLPAIPAITRSGAILTSTPSNGYQWYKDNSLLPNETNQTLSLTANGAYSVVVTDVNGCSNESALFPVVNISVGEISTDAFVSVYPNPADESFFVETEDFEGTEVSVTDIFGKLILKSGMNDKVLHINTENFSRGVVIVSVSGHQRSFRQMLVVE